MSYILAIESSCDDMSIAICKNGEIVANETCTQDQHKIHGGVVPEVASRQHHIDIIPTVIAALEKANISKTDLDAIAFTQGPGLLGSLIVGTSFAKSFALALDIPLIAVHHMHGHILSHFAELPHPNFPFLCLTVSGGHTQIVKVSAYNQMEILGSTIDDAAGEAFDKVGKMLDLPYPAGPHIDRLAQEGKAIIEFAKPRIEGFDYSFSGFKTSVLYTLRKLISDNPDFLEKNLNNICASVQTSIVDILMAKFTKAIEKTEIKEIAVAGGVAANSELRKQLGIFASKNQLNLHIPNFEYCTDNAGMIATVAWFKFQNQEFVDQSIVADARLSFQ